MEESFDAQHGTLVRRASTRKTAGATVSILRPEGKARRVNFSTHRLMTSGNTS